MIPGVMSPLDDNSNVALDPMSAFTQQDDTARPDFSGRVSPQPQIEPMSAPPTIADAKPAMPPPQMALPEEDTPPAENVTPQAESEDAPQPDEAPEPPPADGPSPQVAPKQPERKIMAPVQNTDTEAKLSALQVERQKSYDTERPTYKSNWAKDLGAAILSMGRLAPIAQQITHPKYTQQMNQYQGHVADIAERQKEIETADKIGSEAEKNRAAAEKNQREKLKDKYITVPGGGLYDAEAKQWLHQPVDKSQVTPITPEDAGKIGLSPAEDGKFYLPNAAVGDLVKSKVQPPKDVKTIEERLLQVMADPELAKDPARMEAAKQDLIKAHNLLHPQTPIHGIETDARGNSTLVVADPADPTKVQKVPLGAIGRPEAPPADRGANFVDPESGTLVRVQPGQAVPKGGMTASGFGSANAPTQQMRNVAAQASLVHEQTPMMLAQIDKLRDRLGPVSGRWNEFMQGHVGMEDPDMAGLRADLMMYSSAVALMHARGRLPENLRKEFDNAINAPKQTADNLKAVITRIDNWTAKNIHAMGGNQGGTNTTPAQAHKVGDVVSLKDGSKGTISVVHPDGTFDIK